MQTLVRHASVKRFHPSDQIVHFLNLICRGARRLRHCARIRRTRRHTPGTPRRLRPLHRGLRAHHRHRRMARLLAREGKALRARNPTHRAPVPRLAAQSRRLSNKASQVPAPHEGRTLDRDNAGQRIAYALLVLLNLTLIGTGVLLFILHQPHEQSPFYQGALAAHSFAFKAGVLILLAHIPMGLLSRTTQGDPAWLGRTHSRRDGRKARPALVPRGPRAPCGRARPSRRAAPLTQGRIPRNVKDLRRWQSPEVLLSSWGRTRPVRMPQDQFSVKAFFTLIGKAR